MIHALLLTAAVALGQADAPPPTAGEPSPQVLQLVRQLEADERLKRDEAQQQLVQLGPAILDQLAGLIERAKSADVKHRLEQVQAQLQAQQTQDFAKGRTVTLHGQMPLSAVLAAIETQTGNKIVDYRAQFGQEASDPELKVDLEKVPFWQAVDRVLDLANLTLYSYSGKGGLAVINRAAGEAPREARASYAEAFRIAPTKAIAERDFQHPVRPTLQLMVEAAWEPRFTPIMLQQPMDQIQAVDDQGAALTVDNTRGELEIPVQVGQTAVELPIMFALPPRSSAKIASLKGKLVATVPSKIETFQFDDLTKKNTELRKAGATVLLEQVRKNQDVWEVRMRVRFEQAYGTLESHRGWIYENDAYLLGPNQQRIEHGGFEKTFQGKDEVGVAYLFSLPAGPAGYSFVYKTPAAILRLPVEFELKDVTLP